MTLPTALERRRGARAPLAQARRRFPRLRVRLDAYWEGRDSDLAFDDLDLSLRGVFLPCRLGEPEGAEGIVRIALPGAVEMVRARAVVLRRSEVGRPGMAVRFIELSDAHRARIAAYLVRAGGLAQIPALDTRFRGWAQLEHPLLRREHRRGARG